MSFHTQSVTFPPSTQGFLSVCVGSIMCSVAQSCSLHYNTFDLKYQVTSKLCNSK
jgi:hypothetical protein